MKACSRKDDSMSNGQSAGKPFSRGQGWSGPYTDNSPPARSRYPFERHDGSGTPVLRGRRAGEPLRGDGDDGLKPLPKV
jgi:hypothetical protein